MGAFVPRCSPLAKVLVALDPSLHKLLLKRHPGLHDRVDDDSWRVKPRWDASTPSRSPQALPTHSDLAQRSPRVALFSLSSLLSPDDTRTQPRIRKRILVYALFVCVSGGIDEDSKTGLN